MAVGGETIGRAYIRILADGSGMSEDLRRQLRANDRDFQAAGEESSQAYRRGFNRENRKIARENQATIRNAVADGRGRWNAGGQVLGSELMDGIRTELEKAFPNDVGSQIFRNLRDQFERGEIDFPGIKRALRNLRPEVAKATEQIVRDQEQQWRRLGAAVDRYGEAIDRNGPSRRDLARDMARLRRILPDAVTNSADFRNEMQRMGQVLINTSPMLDRWAGGWDRAGERVGKVFGKGSRNDALNFFGSLAGGLIKIPKLFSSFLKPFTTAVSTFTTMRAEGMGLFASLGSSLRVFMGPALQLGGAVAMIALVHSALGVLASGVVLVTGLVLALAGSLAFALVGALAVVGGALVPFAAAIGVAALAFNTFNKKSGEFKKNANVKAIKSEWKDLQAVAAKGIFGKNLGGLAGVTNILKALHPVVKGVAGAIGGLLTSMAKATEGKGFKDMMTQIGKVLPPMVTSLGKIAGNIGVGLAKAFIAIEPLVTRFLGFLEGISGKFAKAFDPVPGGGKPPAVKFIEEMTSSLEAVGGFIWETIGLVGDLLGLGKTTGDNIFKKMETWVKGIRDWLADPANKDTINKWFTDAEKFGGALGTIVEDVGKLVGKLDTPTNRTILFKLLDIVDSLIGLIGDASGAVEDLATDPAFLNILDNIQKMLDGMDLATEGKDISIGIDAREGGMDRLFGGIVAAAQAADDAITKWITDHRPDWKAIFAPLTTGDPFATLRQRSGEAWAGIQAAWGQVSGFFSGIWMSVSTGFNNFIATTKQRFTELPGQIVQAFVNLPANIWTFVQQMIAPFVWLYNYLIGASLIPDLVNGIVAWFARLPGMIAGALGDISGRFVTWLAGVPQKIQNAVGLVAGAFAGLAGKAITRAGNIASAFAQWVAGLPAKARAIATSVAAGFVNLAGKIIAKAGSLASRFASWVSSLAGKARSTAASIVGGFSNLAGKMISRAGSIASRFGSWVASLPGKAKTIAGNIANAFAGLAGKIITRAGDIAAKFASWGAKAVTSAGRVATNIVSKFSGLATKIVNAIGNIVPKIKMPSIKIPTVIAKVITPKRAAGGIVNGAQLLTVGEAGPEAIVPLNRSLARVDPAVRALSAFAQGLTPPGGATAGPSIGRQIDVGGITINTPTTDPRAVASEVVNRLTFAAYI